VMIFRIDAELEHPDTASGRTSSLNLHVTGTGPRAFKLEWSERGSDSESG